MFRYFTLIFEVCVPAGIKAAVAAAMAVYIWSLQHTSIKHTINFA